MKIKHGMILSAGLGKRMQPITFETPKPLIQIGSKNLLERAIQLLVNYGVEEVAINVHHLADQIKNFIDKKKYKIKIIIFDEKDKLLDTGGGICNATKSFKKPFIVVNPDTLWSNEYLNDLKNLEHLYFEQKKPSLLVVNKNLSFDNSFKGDFNLHNNVISRNNSNEFIFTGLQILDQSAFNFVEEKIFSMNKIWNYLIKNNSLVGIESKLKFYHLNTIEIYNKLLKTSITD